MNGAQALLKFISLDGLDASEVDSALNLDL